MFCTYDVQVELIGELKIMHDINPRYTNPQIDEIPFSTEYEDHHVTI